MAEGRAKDVAQWRGGAGLDVAQWERAAGVGGGARRAAQGGAAAAPMSVRRVRAAGARDAAERSVANVTVCKPRGVVKGAGWGALPASWLRPRRVCPGAGPAGAEAEVEVAVGWGGVGGSAPALRVGREWERGPHGHWGAWPPRLGPGAPPRPRGGQGPVPGAGSRHLGR